MYVFLDPFEKLALIEQADVQSSILLNFVASKESQRPGTIVEIDENNAMIRLYNNVCPVVVGVRVVRVSASLDVDPDRKLGALRSM